MIEEILERCGYPTRVVVVDVETYFDKDYSLSKLTNYEFVTDPRFEVLGWAIRFGGRAWGHFGDLRPKFDWKNRTIVMHNAAFDALVLKEHYGIEPKYIIDTLDLSRHVEARRRNSLAALATTYGLPAKGDTKQFLGLHKADLISSGKIEALREYANNDAGITLRLFEILLPMLTNPKFELDLMAYTRNAFLNPVLQLNTGRADSLAKQMQGEINHALAEAGVTLTQSRSKDYFKTMLTEALGQEPPMKKGKSGPIMAIAKSDPAHTQLLNHENPRVRALMGARVAAKSWPLHGKRIERLKTVANCCEGKLPIPLRYYGGHTGRWSGTQGINLHNLPARGHPLVNKIRTLIEAPPGWTLVIADFAQVEARVLAWVAGQTDLVRKFSAGAEIYCEFASKLVGKRIRKPRSTDSKIVSEWHGRYRQMGKIGILGCIAEGTPIYTDRGWVPIEKITLSHKLWDGTAFVNHHGKISRGPKPCISVHGIWLTPDHEVYGQDGWCPAIRLSTDNPAQAVSMGNLPWGRWSSGREMGLSLSNVCAPVVELLIRIGTTWSPESLHAVMSVLKRHLRQPTHDTGFWTNPTGVGFLIAFVRSLVDAKHDPIEDTVCEAFVSTRTGSLTERIFFGTLARYPAGTIPTWKSIESTITEDMHQEIYASLREVRICETWDIKLVGPRRRYQAGPVIVANCGYGMGAEKCQTYAATTYGVNLTPAAVARLVKLYRKENPLIVLAWGKIEKAFKQVTRGLVDASCPLPGLFIRRDGDTTAIELPSTRRLYYQNAHVTTYDRHENIVMPDPRITGAKIYMWGGYLIENIVQAVSRDILAEAIFRVQKLGFTVPLTVHDDMAILVPTDQAEQLLPSIVTAITTPPKWAADLPITVEARISREYSK